MKRLCVIAIAALAQTTACWASENPLAPHESRENAKALPSRYVDDMLDRFDQACAARDGEKILEQLSPEAREHVSKRKPDAQSLYDHIAYLCKDIQKIGKTLRDPGLVFATFKKGNNVRLCFRAPGDLKCKGELRVAFEDNKLKINEH